MSLSNTIHFVADFWIIRRWNHRSF